jgi:hypothetical protein
LINLNVKLTVEINSGLFINKYEGIKSRVNDFRWLERIMKPCREL